jgi:hypothetical protein
VDWPELPYEAWQETRDTLHMYIQIVGKIRAALTPVEEAWGHAPLYVTARGVNTSPIPHPNGVFDIDVDFIDHVLSVRTTEGRVDRIRLAPRAVADFYAELMGVLDGAGLAVEIKAVPSDIPDGIPFAEDAVHASYEPEWANRFWRVLVCVDRVLKEHRSHFRGKTSPVQLWWGSFDLAYCRFSGGLPDTEHAAVGFWPGDKRFPHAAFYAYISPKPDGIEAATLEPHAAFWSNDLGEFLLPYEAMRASPDPRAALIAFLESSYRAGSERGGWDAALEIDGG